MNNRAFRPLYFCLCVIAGAALLLNGCTAFRQTKVDTQQLHARIISALTQSGFNVKHQVSSYYITVHNQSDTWELFDSDFQLPASFNLDTAVNTAIARLESAHFTVTPLYLQTAPPVTTIRLEIRYNHLLIGIITFHQKISGYAAIVIDDLGHNTRALSAALNIDRPLTFAVLPQLAKSSYLADILHKNGQLIMLHQPMAPEGSLDPGPGAILAGMNARTIEETLSKNIQSIPYVSGINNHMGSLITADTKAMRAILSYLKKNNIFFFDSVTGKSVCSQVAQELQFPIYTRDVFLDNEHTKEYINTQLDRLIYHAISHGKAIGIGHFHSITLECIRDKTAEFDEKNIKLVFISDLQPGY